MKKIKVLIVDDSAVIRKLFFALFKTQPDIEVVGLAEDPYQAREILVQKKPDLMILDIEMPRMDGISFLKKVMQHFPTRTIICSSLGKEGSEMYFKAIKAGALDVIEKPKIQMEKELSLAAKNFLEKVRAFASAEVNYHNDRSLIAKPSIAPALSLTDAVIAIAASTGGTEAIKTFLLGMPQNIPGTVIVQHMPPIYSKHFAVSLNKDLPFEVKEAESGDIVKQGRVLIAPGDFHMELKKSGHQLQVVLHQEPPLHSVRPAADYLLKSAAQLLGPKAIGVVLTGMGRDGAAGLLEMRKSGAATFAQDEASSVVYGMPKVAFEIGAAERVASIEKLASEVLQAVVKIKSNKSTAA